MRTNLVLTTILAAALLAIAVGAAVAQPPSNRGTDRAAAVAEMHAARNESLRQFQEARAAALAAHHAAINATKASFLENKTKVIDACPATRNATADDNNSAFAKCVRDGLQPLIEKARGEHAAARETLRERLLEARQDAMQAFAAKRAEIRQRHAST